jgi:hypothetical protein
MSAEARDVMWPEDVAGLIETVERLAAADQRRIVRVVDLLLVAPPSARCEAQAMLRGLLKQRSGTKQELIGGLDDVIARLEAALEPTAQPPRAELFACH